jgi:hypothetical protein
MEFTQRHYRNKKLDFHFWQSEIVKVRLRKVCVMRLLKKLIYFWVEKNADAISGNGSRLVSFAEIEAEYFRRPKTNLWKKNALFT